ncbi:MAG: glycoside hydrolase family 140 protein [Lentisphaeria bacterium]|nr:glycoside hydrolase family 140 protein [Lentisphaeria bacterium]
MSDSGCYLQHEDGTPFFWLGDTAWQLFVALDRDETRHYLDNRAGKGFNVIQAVLLGEYRYKLADRGLGPTRNGHLPLVDGDPARPLVNDGPGNDYWDDVENVLDEAARRGLYVGLLPVWGCNYVSGVSGSPGKPIFNTTNARTYGRFLGERYREQPNIIWILGGDDNPVQKGDVRPVYRAMAEGIAEGVTGKRPAWNQPHEAWDDVLMSFHPRGGQQSSRWLHQDAWLDLNMLQVGHGGGRNNPNSYRFIEADRGLQPPKPVLDAEPPYEDHPNWKDWREAKPEDRDAVRFRAFDVRQAAYWSVLSGAAGYTYGHHAVWPFYVEGSHPINFPDRPWTDAIDRPGARQMTHVRKLFETYTLDRLVPDQTQNLDGSPAIRVARDVRGTFLLAYTPEGHPLRLDLTPLVPGERRATWYDPRTGQVRDAAEVPPGRQQHTFDPPGGPAPGNDWILIVE